MMPLYAKFTTEKLRMTTEVLRGAAPRAMLFTCWSTARMIEWAKATSVTMIDYGEDDELAILHAVPTAEGAIRTAIENTEDTLLGMHVLCFGLGRVGLSVADAFRSMKAKVSLAARNPAQLARAWTLGFDPIHLRDLANRSTSLLVARLFVVGARRHARDHRRDQSRCRDHRPLFSTRQRRLRSRQGARAQGDLGARASRPCAQTRRI